MTTSPSIKPLLVLYNKIADKPVKGFTDLKTARRHVLELLSKRQKPGKCPTCRRKYKGKSTKRFVDCRCGVRYCPQTGRVISVDSIHERKRDEINNN